MIQVAMEAAKEGGEVLKKYFETSLQRRIKDDSSIVTEADEETDPKETGAGGEVEKGGEQQPGADGNKIAGYDPVVMPSIEFFYRTPVLGGIVRLYGGGGFWVGFRPFAMDVDDPATDLDETAVMNSIPFVGGGHYGMEIFAKPNKAFFIEIGGQGPAHALWVDAGASILAGSVWYLGKR